MDIRVGFGYDIHRFSQTGKPFLLGGVAVSGKCIEAHSDGDALLHSLSNALLSSVGLDDIGCYFPDNSKETADMNSKNILLFVLNEIEKLGYSISNVVVDIHLEQPKLKEYRNEIKKSLSRLLKIDQTRIALHANTGEKLGPIGNEECVAVYTQVCVIKD